MKRYLMMIKYRQYRWAARLTGIIGMVFFVSYFTAVGYQQLAKTDDASAIIFVLILFALCLLSYILSWFAEIVGGTLLTTAAVLLPLYVFYCGLVEITTAISYYALPFLIPGILFMVAWRIKVIRQELPNNA